MGSPTEIDVAGMTIVCKDLRIGETVVGGASGTSLSSTELGLLDTVSATSGVVASKAVIANSSGAVPFKPGIIAQTAATLTLTAAQSGSRIYLDKIDGITVTLPASAVGLTYEFFVKTSVTSVGYKLSTATQNTEFFNGTYNSFDIDGTGVVGVVFTGDGTTHDNLTMNGTTTGGLVGTELIVTCTAANLWTVSGFNRASGTVATAFATS